MRKGQWTAPAPAVYGKGRPAKIPVGGGPLIPPAGYKGAAPAAFSNKQSQNWQQQQQQQSWQGQGQKEDTGPPRVLNLQLFQESQLTTQGFPPEAPAIVYDKSMHVFSSAHSILQEIVGDISVEVEIHHDTEWDIFPEIGESIRHAGGEELCFSVGTCPNQGRWAVGIANGWKGRETAVKLALGFSLLADRSPDELENFCKNYPEFRVMVAEAGLLPSRGPPKRSAFNASQGQQWQSSPKQNSWSAPPAPAGGGFPKFVWASLDNTAGLVQEGLPAEGLCVYHDKQFADLFRNGQYVLQEVLGDVGSEVVFTHDPDWEVMPEMAEAIKQAGGEENCYAVASVPSAGIWAVGLAGGWKVRELACKLALSVALVASSGDFDRFAAYPDFVEFAQTAGTPGAMVEEPALKKPKVETPAPRKVLPQPGKKGGHKGGKAQAQGKKGGPIVANRSSKALPRDTPVWVQLPQDQLAPEILQELGSDAVAVASDGPSSALYDCIDAVLADLVTSAEDLVYFDDPNHETFPEVSLALQTHASLEEPLQLAICSTLGVWGIGVGPTPDARTATSKLAVAAMIALKAAETGDVPDLSAYPDFSDFVGAVQPPI